MRTRPETELRTARLLIREPEARDADALVAGIGDFRVSQWLGRVPYPYSRRDAEDWIAYLIAANRDGREFGRLITLHDGRVIGGIGLHRLRDGTEPEEFGYWLGVPWWGRGYATEAAECVLRYGFDTLGASAVPSGVFVGNDASLRVQAKLGFEVVGSHRVMCVARQAEIMRTDTLLTRERFRAATTPH